MQLSIVTTLYQSASHIEEFCRRVTETAKKICSIYEIILVNDGSPDDSLAVSLELARRDAHITIVDLSRNFGHHKALMTGLTYARGEYVFLIESDLEEPPELLETFWHLLQEDKETDVIFGVQRKRKGKLGERLGGSIYYWLFNALSSIKVPKNVSFIRLMTKRYVQSLLLHREHELVFNAISAMAGYRQKPYLFTKGSKNSTSYNLTRKLGMLANGIASFSNKPLIYIFYMGMLMSVIACMLLLYFIMKYLTLGVGISGWTSLIVSLWALGGIIVVSLGIIGIYLAKVFTEVKDRPYTVVRAVHRSEE